MIPSTHCLSPSSSLPPVRSLCNATEETITAALHSLQTLYCPLRLPVARSWGKDGTSTPAQVDSGYVSEDEVAENESGPDSADALALLRADEFERSFAIRWLTSLISRADELPFDSEDSRDCAVDDAAFILSSFSDTPGDEIDESLTRDFSFPNPSSNPIHVRLNDAPLSGVDHTDVGLQSWGASIVFSELMCASPERFGLHLLPANASIIELGAGTGLISLTLAKLLPNLSVLNSSILGTDYHPAVLDNLRTNIVMNFGTADGAPIDTMLLDWSAPPPSLKSSADMLFAADVVYAPEHALWLRDCAAHLLTPDGVFWLVVTVRKDGKFEGIPDTAEAAFLRDDCPQENGRVLRIAEKVVLEKQRGVGRGDESGYMLFGIRWA